MIVEPGFLDHWKTQALIKALNSPAAPLLLIRLWEHCQNRKTHRFPNLADQALALICRWDGDPARLRETLILCGFVRDEKGVVVVHDWEVTNRILVSAWKNGNKGGRPRKTDRIPVGNRPLTDPSLSNNISVSEGGLLEVKEGDCKGKPKKEAEVIEFCASIGLPASDGEYFWNKWVGNGFQNNRKAMRDWKAVIRSWKAAGHLPSQHQRNGNGKLPASVNPNADKNLAEMNEGNRRLREFYAKKGIQI